MQVRIEVAGITYRVEGSRAFDLSIPMTFDRGDEKGMQPQAFGLPRARATAVQVGSFVGDVHQGGSCNCDTISLTPHGNGTHTEGVGHITDRSVPLASLLHQVFLPATLVTSLGRGEAITEAHLRALDSARPGFLEAVVVRSHSDGPLCNWSGTHPPCFTVEAIHYLKGLGVRHLVTDLPSLDPEADEGRLSAHRAFWSDAEEGTVTEMAWIPESIPDGSYVLNLQIPNFVLDAAPSRPLLFEVTPHVP